MYKVTTTIVGFALLSGCAALAPVVQLEAQHTSHVTQHMEGSRDQNYGYNAVMVNLQWNVNRLHVNVADGLVLDHRNEALVEAFGGLSGPREVFQATVALDLWRP